MFFSRVVMLRLSFGWASCQPFKRFTCSFENRSITLICRPVQTPFLVCVANFYGRQQFYDQLHLLQIYFPCSDQPLLEKTAAPKYLSNQIESGPKTNKICMGCYYLYMFTFVGRWFLPDPGVSGVRSMGPNVGNSLHPRAFVETLLMWLWLIIIATQYDWWCQYKAIPGNS